MALTKNTTNAYNLKRAERFAAAGINSADVAYAHPEFTGIGDTSCSLCDHDHIVYLFRLRFDAPSLVDSLGGVAKGITRTDEVVFDNVGSTCITQWFDALPESKEKLEALKRWHAEVKKMKAAMTRKVVESLCAQAGYESPEDAYKAYKSLNLSYGSAARNALTFKERKQLKRNASKVCNAKSSRATVKAWLASLAKALAAQSAAPVPTPPATPMSIMAQIKQKAAELAKHQPADELAKLSAEDRDLVLRGRAAWKAGKANLNEWEKGTFTDIGQKVVKWGSFAPGGKQRALFVKLLSLLEKQDEPAKIETKDAPFVSPSGIEGARY